MYKSIVVGTDGSGTAAGAVAAATALARALDAELHVVSVHRLAATTSGLAAASGIPVDTAVIDEATQQHAQETVDDAVGRARAEGVEATPHVRAGVPSEVLVTLADEVDADLIVVGNRGMHGVRRVLGSVPNHVAHHARCAVMIVPTS